MHFTGQIAAYDPTTSTDEPFYERLAADRFRAGRFTMSPWDPAMQHGSPPTALLVHAMLAAHPAASMRVARVAAEFLGAIPRGDLSVRTRVARPGRRIDMLEGELVAGERPVVAARVWRVAAAAAGSVPAGATPTIAAAPLPGPEGTQRDLPTFAYAEAIEWRYVAGGRGALGPATVWMRSRAPLIGGETLSALDRLLLIVDSANGISPEHPFDAYAAVPMSLALAIARYPVDAWTLLEARTVLSDDGLGFTSARYADRAGELGVGSQPLLVAPAGNVKT